jgi:predicted Zn-dependent protease
MRDALLRRADQVSLRAVTRRPDDAEAWGARANVLFFRGQLDAAAEAVQRGLLLNPYLVPLQSFSGQIRLAQGRGEQALAAFDRSIELNPVSAGHGVLMHFRCRALLLLARYAEAIESCERGMAFGPEWPDYMVLTAAYALQGDARHAAQARAELMRLQPAFSIRWHEALAGGSAGGARTQFDELLHAGLRKAGVPE